MRYYTLLLLSLCLHIAAWGQTIASLDDIDLSGLPQPTTAKALRYWFDDDAGSVKTTTQLKGTMTIDASALIDGLHTLYYQTLGTDGEAYHVVSALFMKVGGGSDASVTAKKLLYWFDDETAITTVDAGQGVQLLDASHLMDGLHTIHYQMLCSNGVLTPVSSSLFMRVNSDAGTTTAKQLRYWFDDDASSLKVIDVVGGTQTLDVSSLPTGLHTLNYQLIDGEGKAGAPVIGFFMKTFDKVVEGGENCVTKYQYWLNSNSQAMQTVTLSNTANPYQLISLLPMQKEPIHSDCFHFEVTDGVPTIYAKNILHIRFHDAAGYFADGDKPFVDYSVKQEVTDAEQLTPGVSQVTACPAENAIRWYRFEANPGDTVAFKTSQAATIQVFSPDGQEVYTASGSESVAYGGCHTWQAGTYFVALHDVTGSQSNISLDYFHMDKYDVVSQDVTLVGNGGCSTITFQGNGFRDLWAVDLFNEQGDSIHHVYIGHESDATTSVVFDFTDAALGTYHAKFRFAEEGKPVANVVTVEEAKEIEIETEVQYASTYLMLTTI